MLVLLKTFLLSEIKKFTTNVTFDIIRIFDSFIKTRFEEIQKGR